MINKQCAKKFCYEDPSLIENYDLAIVDQTQTWDCHHRGEILPCGRYEAKDLKKFDLYYNRPASELIFLPHDEHISLHQKGVQKSEAHKQAISDAMKGVNAKKVIQYTKSGEFVREWESMTAIWQELGIAHSNICACCQGNRKSAGGFIWKFKQKDINL